MTAILKLISEGWVVTLRKNWDGFYVEARGDGEHYMGYDLLKLSAAIHDMKKKMKAAGIS